MSINKATLRLFKAVPIQQNKGRLIDKDLMKQTIPRGYIFSPEVVNNYTPGYNISLLMQEVEVAYGITAESLNASFHKSWGKVKDTPQEELMVEQIAHYLTLIVIKGYTKEELKDKLMVLITSGIALKEETVKDCVEVAEFVGLEAHEVVTIKNKEVKIALYDKLGLTPTNPVEFLRYAVYKATGETLLIKNKMLTEKIKESDVDVYELFERYSRTVVEGMAVLAQIFYRFKPIFLAFRGENPDHYQGNKLRVTINKIRRLAVKYHKPMPEDFLNAVTARLKRGIMPGLGMTYLRDLQEELDRVNTFRKIRLAYALKYRTKDVDSILYKIRNGKGYATDFSFENKGQAEHTLEVVVNSIVEDVKKNVNGRRIYIPDYIHYALPATEKQFTGNFPSGTYVTVPKDIIFGINWKNVPGHRVDLDLSVIFLEDGKIGWDSGYTSSIKDILFSGDITDAQGKHGATELFHVRRPMNSHLIFYVNYYNYDAEYPVPFKIIVAKDTIRKSLKESYMVNPNDLVAQTNSNINQKMKILGLVVTTPEESKFYFTETYMSNSITARDNEQSKHSRNYLFNFYEDSISLEDVLVQAGATITRDKYADESIKSFDINLSPEALEKDTIINFLTKEK